MVSPARTSKTGLSSIRSTHPRPIGLIQRATAGIKRLFKGSQPATLQIRFALTAEETAPVIAYVTQHDIRFVGRRDLEW